MSGRAPVEVVVLDLDGVLADTRHRLHHLAGRQDWDAFFAAAVDDPAHPEGLALAAAAAARAARVVYLSGRPERTRADTTAWLARVGAPPGPLVLRADGDRRPAQVVKVQALRDLGRERVPDLLVDDDPEVTAAVRAAGRRGPAGRLAAARRPHPHRAGTTGPHVTPPGPGRAGQAGATGERREDRPARQEDR